MTSFAIKLIALITMIIDHCGDLVLVTTENWSVYYTMRIIGRIAFPTYVFLMVQGCRHTSNIKKYMQRLLIFAFISEIPFDFKRGSPQGTAVFFDFSYQNVFFTLFLGVLTIYFYEKYKEEYADKFGICFFTFIKVLISARLAEVLNTDYGATGVLMVFFVYVSQDIFTFIKSVKWRQILMLAVFILILYIPGTFFNLLMALGAGLCLIPIAFYNGKRGPSMKMIFYAAYPVHLVIIGIITLIIVA